MSDKLKAKVEKAVEDYADLLIKRIEAANADLNADSVVKVDEAVRMLAYMVTTLGKIDRPFRGNGTDGQDN